MFIMNSVGAKISELRKKRNMTQMELADKMNISFQAVSNWERGNSMPDIGKLPELAQLFGVTIDELLGEESRVIHAVMDDKMEECTITPEELSAVAPILQPQQVDTLFEKLPQVSWEEIMELLPFVSQDVIDQLANKAWKEGDETKLRSVSPYVSPAVMDDIAQKMEDMGKSIKMIAPFVSSKKLDELAQKRYARLGMEALANLLPFLSQALLKKIARKEFDTHGVEGLPILAPFLDKDTLEAFAQESIKAHGLQSILPIVPFLGQENLTEYIKKQFL